MRDADARAHERRGAVDCAPADRQAVLAAHRRGDLCEHQTEAQLLLLEHRELLEMVDTYLDYPGPRDLLRFPRQEQQAAMAITLKIKNLMGKANARAYALGQMAKGAQMIRDVNW